MRTRTVVILFMAAAAAIAQPLPNPTFMEDVYMVSPYGDSVRARPMWWATDTTAFQVAKRLGAIPVMRDSSPQTGPPLRRWATVHLTKQEVPPAGYQIRSPQPLLSILQKPQAMMWLVRFTSTGCEINAGYLADYYGRNANMVDGGDRLVRRIVAGECGDSSFLMSMVKLPVTVVKRMVGKRKYPSPFMQKLKMHKPKTQEGAK